MNGMGLAVAQNHVDVRQAFAQALRLLRIDFNHRDVHPHRHNHLRQIVADAPAAQQHDVLHAQGVLAQKAKIVRNRHHIARNVHPVARVDDEIAVGDDDLAGAFDNRVQHAGNSRQPR